MPNQTELTKMSFEQHDAVRRNETVETTCTEFTNKETNLNLCISQDSNKDTLIHQTQHVTTCIHKHFRNLSDFAVKGKYINDQKQNMRNVTVEFKAGLEQVLTKRIAKRENPFDLETSKETISTNESCEEEHKNCTKTQKIRKVRALVGFNQCIENIVQELTERNQSENHPNYKTTDNQLYTKEKITQFPQTLQTLQINSKRRTSFDTSKNQYFIYTNNFDHFDKVDADTSVNTTQTNNLIIHSNNNTNTLNIFNSIIPDIESQSETISTEKPKNKTLITNNTQIKSNSINIPQPEETQHVSGQHIENLLVEPEKDKIVFVTARQEKLLTFLEEDTNPLIKTLQEMKTKDTCKIVITDSFISETTRCIKLKVLLNKHSITSEIKNNTTNIRLLLKHKKGLLKFTRNMVRLR